MTSFRRSVTPYLFIAPFYLLFIVFGLVPLVGSFGMSLFAWRGANPGNFVEFGNYIALTRDPAFWRAFLNTILLWLGTVPTITFLGLVFAVILNSHGVRAQRFFRITVPLMRPILVFTTVLATIGIFSIFDEPFVLYGTQGGPGEAGIFLGTLMYRNAFEYFQLGYASAIAYVVVGCVFIA